MTTAAPTETVLRGYRFVLDPTPTQAEMFESHAGGARFAYNHMLARVKANLSQREAERSYGIPDEELTPALGWSAKDLNDAFNAVKDADAPWNRENSSRIYLYATRDLAQALKNWSDGKKGARRHMGFPRFHSRRSRKSFTFTATDKTLLDTRHHVKLPKIGVVHTLESTRRLYRLIEQGRAKVKTATVSLHRGRWQVSILAEITRAVTPQRKQPRVVGIDLGVKDWIVAATPDGAEVLRVPFPAELKKLDERKRKLQRRYRNRQRGDKRTGQQASNRWRQAQKRINKVDYKMAAIREDMLHKATTGLARLFDVVVMEDLNVAGMKTRGGAHKRGLNRALQQSGMAMTRTMMSYKASELILVDRFYPSSKRCSSCGETKAKLTLGERVYRCGNCGLETDRDLNAAINLARQADVHMAESPSVSARGAERKPAKPSGAAAAGDEARSRRRQRQSVGVTGNGGTSPRTQLNEEHSAA
ncbi:IS607 family element RNA-guided endonuclease TnpB [Mycobacteroides abscessus]|uniref:IS607 family element RNA-guided endonuclease TnpB n=1 Tax=Mycobacteroides abscessus TaxID=36809 RepID=UPI0007F959BF|nr:IS607 family element RNA-guided endonuclease TnpB [Mycobacteroides abscessus]ANO12787.1 hypothetical protein BAB77_02000 [Mycobacteroides abscessus]ARQ63039.1 hypothetical protein CAK77_02180 [Mycobacteroides abscessus subsp. massiliense]MBE5447548.1 hypothetical protein [Mycobacteroides abscessus]MBE5514169.1 hypothetical protein [Mycobacteroides abscessus]MBN7511791.1 transposase [Mycobacteroides abscessus subsp. massiliense]